ncbi:MAG: nucleotidyltransferase family protein [Deltaproteobacteria bacterium]|nr:nucleotidyltransferase family protein [Deltaproteobacteria bacterium]
MASASAGPGLADVVAAILAGGKGTRLEPVVSDRPKVLADVSGRPFLAYLLDQLVAAGVRRVVLCTGYKASQVSGKIGHAWGPLRVAYSEEPLPLGTAGALRHALPMLESEDVLVMNGDSSCSIDLAAFYRAHRERHATASLLLARVSDRARYGSVLIDDSGWISSFVEKGSALGSGWINAGIYLVERARLATIPEGKEVSLERDVFPSWLEGGLHGVRCDSPFLDIGTPESYATAFEFFAGAKP